MIKKISLPIIIAVMIVQFLVPVSMIIYSTKIDNIIIENGTEYKFKIYFYDAYDGVFRFRFKSLPYNIHSEKYSTISALDDGFAEISSYTDKKPNNADYVRNNETNIKRMTTFKTQTDYNHYRDYNLQADSHIEGYVVAKVYKGSFVVQDLYIEDMPVEEWLELSNSGGLQETEETETFEEW